MLDFQKIRNKQKWLFALIAIPVIFGFVILFTPDAEDRLFGRNNLATGEGTLGAIDGKPVTRNEWLTARQLIDPFGRYDDRFVEGRIPNTLVELKLLDDYSINISEADVIKQLKEEIQNAGPRGEQMRTNYLSLNKRDADAFTRSQMHFIGVAQLQRLAGVGSGLVSEKEAEIKFREENDEYEAEAIILSHTNYLPLVQIDDAKLQAYYTNSISKYRLSESRQLSYVTFPPTNYLDQAEAKYNELPEADRKSLLQNCWPTDTNITDKASLSIVDLAGYVATVQTNEFAGMKTEEVTAQVREKLLTTSVGLKAGLAVIEAYTAGEDFQASLLSTYNAKPELDTLDKMALLQNLEVRTTPPMRRDLPFVPGLQRVTPAEVFALTATNALINGASSLSGAGNADPYFVASLKKVTLARDRSFAEAKPLITEDYKKAESIKLLNEAGEKLTQALKDEKPLADIAKENNLTVIQLGPFGRSGGTIEGLDTPAVAEDLRAEVTGLGTGATSELITSSTDNDVTDHEVAFIVKLKGKQPVSKETFDKEFPDYLKNERRIAAGSAYTAWLDEKTKASYKYSFNAYVEKKDTGTVTVDGKTSETAEKYFGSTTVVPIIATPAKGFEFKEWQGTMREGQSNPKNSVLIIDNSSRTAVFVPKTEEAK